MHPFLHQLWQGVAGVLVPESLAVDKARQAASRRGVFELVAPRAAMLRPGDLIVVRTPGTFYKIFRSAAKHKVDHLAIVMENGMFLHVGPPTIRLLPVELLLTPNRRPLVFRPKLSEDELNQLMRSLKSLLGQEYDTVRVYSFVARLAAQAYLGKAFPLKLPKALAAGDPRSATEDLVYTNQNQIPLQSGAWVPKGQGMELNQAAIAVAEENRARARSKRITTVGGRHEEDIDSAPFLASAASAAPAAAASTPAASAAVPSDYGSSLSQAPAGSVICTDAIMPRLMSASPEWRDALNAASASGSGGSFSGAASLLRRKLDFFKLRSWSINDVFHFSAMRPDLLQRLHLPPVHMPAEFKDLSDAEEQAHKRSARASGAAAPAATRAAGPNVPPANPVASFFQHPLAANVDAYLSARHPELHSRSVQLQQVLAQVYETSTPLFRSLLQLYSYTMRNLPPQLQHAVRLYLLLMMLRQIVAMWRGFVMVRQGVRVAKGVVRTAGGIRRRARTSSPKNRSSNIGRRQSKSRSRSRSPSSSSSRSSSPSPSRRSLRAAGGRQLDALSGMLSHPQTAQIASLVVEQVLPGPSARLVQEIMASAAASAPAQRRGATSSHTDNAAAAPQTALNALLSSAAATSFASVPAAAAVAASSSGRKRSALKQFAKSSATVAFPRLTRLVRFGKGLHQLPAASSSQTAPPLPLHSSDAASTSSAAPSPPSPSPAAPSSSSSAAPSAASISASRHALFAHRHPHLTSLVEQLQLLLVSAVAAQFIDQLRSAL